MNTRHYLWFGNLLILGLLVWTLSALGFSLWESRLNDLILSEGPVAVGTKDAPKLKSLKEYEAIAEYAMFGGEPEEKTPPPAPKEEAAEEPEPEKAVEVSGDGLRLKGTIIDENQKYLAAILEDSRSRDQDLYKPGSTVNKNEVVSIFPDSVVLRRDGKVIRLTLGQSEDKASPSRSRRPRAPTARDREPEPEPDPEGEIAQEVGEGRYIVSRDTLSQHMGDLNYFMSNVRIMPYFKDGQAHGFKVAAVRPGSPIHELGFRRGDVIVKVNETPLNSPEDLVNLYRQMQQLETVVVEVERGGSTDTMTYSLR